VLRLSEGVNRESSPQRNEPRQPLLPFVAVWRRTRYFSYYALAVVIIAIVVNYFSHHHLQVGFVILGAAILLMAIGLQFGAKRHYVVVETDGLRISGLVRSELIPFEVIRQVRVQRLQVLFAAPSRRNRLDRSLRTFSQTPACLARLDLDRAAVDSLGRLLGRGTAIDQDLIFVVAEAEELEKRLLQRVRPHPSIRAGKAARS
jgi:hypothetical protein